MSEKCYTLTESQIESLKAEARAEAIDACIEVVDKIIDACITNGGCRSKCDEPYACVFGIDIKAEIEQLKEQQNNAM